MKRTRVEHGYGFEMIEPRWSRRFDVLRLGLRDWLFIIVLVVLVGVGGTYGVAVLFETDPFTATMDRDGP